MPAPKRASHRVHGYRDLLVWQRAMDLVVEVYRLAETAP
jgi:hypothetical protein